MRLPVYWYVLAINTLSHLSRKLGVEEVVLQQVQSREAQAVERASVVEQEREKERYSVVCGIMQ